jgi:predicted nucleic acid-binding protein
MMDTSAFVALVEEQDDALLCNASLQAHRFLQYVTSTVMAETHRRLLFDHGRDAALRFLRGLYRGDTTIVRPEEQDERSAVEIIERYADLRLSLCDALTSAVMLRLGVKRVFTYDRAHFLPIGFVTVPPLDVYP